MAPSRGKGKAAVKGSASGSSRSGRRATRSRARNSDDDVPDVYRFMLAEAGTPLVGNEDGARPLKKRKVTPSKGKEPEREAPSRPDPDTRNVRNGLPIEDHRPPPSSLQTVEDSSESDASQFEFEDVDLEGPAQDPTDGIEDLAISVPPESSTKPRLQPRRKPGSGAEKSQRLLVHKLHVLCLLAHCMYVNGRCNNAVAQKHLRKLLSEKTISYLNPKTSDSQFQRNRSFMEGLQQAVDTFNAECRPSGAGLMRPHWSVEGEPERPFDSAPIDRSDFIKAADSLEGTQDMGNQLFASMLRAAGVDARIVCSLQVLPFASVAKPATPRKPMKETILAIASYDSPSKRKTDTEDEAVKGSSTIGKVPSARRRLGQPSFAADDNKPPATPRKKTRPAPKLSYPVFWVEAFNEAQQKWIPIDPVVTHTINKSAKLEPPSSYEYNQLLYIIAFEDDGTARDVTRRYAKAYNAKTRRHRVEASADGAKWMKKVMRFFRRRGGALDRDQVEDSELAQKEAKEGMPANVLDFKDHPYYALERHLKRHEVIHPRREVGKVNAGTAAKPRMEAVFRRKDVLVCRSADKWYRIGREVKEGEQPLKHVPARTRRQQSPEDEENGDAAPTTGLYAPYQTQLYAPPPVQRGRIPKNVYGNLDVYAPSMVPAGSVHIRHSLAQRAARLVKVDYADAVTGFKFQGRHGTAVMEGVVVAQQFGDAVKAVIEGFEEEALEEESRSRSLLALRVWKRFLTGLRIRDRVEGYGDGSKKAVTDENEEILDAAFYAGPMIEDERPMTTAGKYTIDELLAPAPKPPPAKKKRVVEDDGDEEYAQVSDEGAGFEPGGFFPIDGAGDVHMAGAFMPAGDDVGGGFLPDHDEEDGGFFPQDHGPGEDGEFLPETGVDEAGGGFMAGSGEEILGGGFIPDNQPEDEGGGLLPDTNDHDEAGGFLPEDTHEETAGGFLLDNHADHSTKAQQQNDENDIDDTNMNDEDLFGETIAENGGEAQAVLDTATDATAAPNLQNDNTAPAPSEKVYGTISDPPADEEAEDNDKASLPSHDSEDEDAEPDWLDSD